LLETQRSQRKYYFSFAVERTAKEKLSALIDKQATHEQVSAPFSLWSGIQLDHRFENGQPLSGKLADPFVVNFKYLF